MTERRNRNLAGIMLAAVSSLLVILLGVLGKKLGGEMSPFVVVFLCSLFSFVLFLPAAFRGGGLRRVSSRVPAMQAVRAFATRSSPGWIRRWSWSFGTTP